MAILPAGDIPGNPLQQGSSSRRRSGRTAAPLPLTGDLHASLSRPVPTPANDWYAIFRNLFLGIAGVAVIGALLIVVFSDQLTPQATLTSARPSSPATANKKRETANAGTIAPAMATAPVPSASIQPAVYHPEPFKIEIRKEAPDLSNWPQYRNWKRNQPSETNHSTLSNHPSAPARPLRRTSPSVPLLPDPDFR